MSLKVGDTFDTYEEYAEAFNEFCESNNLNFIKSACHTISSYYGKQECGPELIQHLSHLKFKRLVYSCPSKRSGGICDAQIIVIADKFTAKLKVSRLNKFHSPGCYLAQEILNVPDESKPIEVTNIQSIENRKRKSSVVFDDWNYNEDFENWSDQEESETGVLNSSLLDTPPSLQNFMPTSNPSTSKLSTQQLKVTTQNHLTKNLNEIWPTENRRSQANVSGSGLLEEGLQRPAYPRAHVNTETAGVHQASIDQTESSISSLSRTQVPSGTNNLPPIPPQTPDSADTLFFSSLCAQVQDLPRSVRNHLKIKFLEMVNNALDGQ